ncbi:MAG: phage portal protein, partial [Oscillospiraceae bacterium]
YLYQQLLAKTGLPSTTKGGSSTSDTGSAVLLRDGWQQAETRARATETLFVEAEKLFLKTVLHISKDMRGLDLKLSDISIKFTRHITDNALVKVQALTGMLNAGINPQVAISHCGMFHDPADVYAQSKEYLKKWEVNTNGVQEKTSEKAEIKEGGNARGTM